MADKGVLIDPSQFPATSADLDPSRVRDSARDLRTMGGAVEDKTVTVKATWDRLGACFCAPEQDQVLSLMAPAVTAAADVRAAFTGAGQHLDTYAGELEAIRPRLVRLEARARTFHAAV